MNTKTHSNTLQRKSNFWKPMLARRLGGLWIIAFIILLIAPEISAKVKAPDPNEPVILTAKIDRDLSTLFVTGVNLHDSATASVATLGGIILTNNFFDPADDTILAYDLPPGLTDGHLQLILAAPSGFLQFLVGAKVSDSEHADSANIALHALTSDAAITADHALQADLATFATNAQDAENALQAQDAVNAQFALEAADAHTVDGHEGDDLEESAEIDADIATHAGDTNAHHSAFTDGSKLNTALGIDALLNNTIGVFIPSPVTN